MSDILYSNNPSMFRNSPIGAIISIALIPAFGLGIIILLFWYLSCKAKHLEITENFVTFTTGLMSKDRIELPRSKVRAVRVKQGVFQRMLGVGDISIYTTGDKPECVAPGFPDPLKVRDLLRPQE